MIPQCSPDIFYYLHKVGGSRANFSEAAINRKFTEERQGT